MDEIVLLGRGRNILTVPRQLLDAHLDQVPEHSKTRLSFMTDKHHEVRYYVVREMPRIGKAISPEQIARDLDMPTDEVKSILDELEQNLFFLVRDGNGAVSWAFPVTTEVTPHRLTFRDGVRLYGAWGEDALAAPFVQGKLHNELLTVKIETECVHCGRPLELELNSAMEFQSISQGASPLVFQPDINWAEFTEPNIVHAYWQNSTFFWSEEHARDYREAGGQVDGIYLTMAQSAHVIPVSQSGLFGFNWSNKLVPRTD